MKKLSAYILYCLYAMGLSFFTKAQSPIGAFTATYISTTGSINNYTANPAANSGSFSGCVATNYTYTFTNGTANAWRLLNITANNTNYFVASNPAVIRLRRVDNAVITGNRSIIFLESTTSPSANCPSNNRFDFKASYEEDMEVFLDNHYINQGTDNIFTNKDNGDGNNNNIERVDVLFFGGLSSFNTANAGFALFERGVNNAHDGFRIAAITAIDASGNPTSFGPLVTCVKGNGSNNGSWGHPTTANGNRDLPVYVLRKEASDPLLKSSAAVNQQVGGVFFTYASLGIAPNQVFYGYALFGPDGIANPTNAQLLNLTDATVYPTNTTEAIGGGLDLIAINAAFITGGPFLPLTLTSFSANAITEGVLIRWALAAPTDDQRITLEYSIDNNRFYPLYTNASDTASMSYVDRTITTTRWYRLAYKYAGVVQHSPVVQVPWSAAAIKVYPSRLKAGGIINITGISSSIYRAQLITSNGSVVKNALTGMNNRTQVTVSSSIMRGTYFLQLVDAGGKNVATKTIIIE